MSERYTNFKKQLLKKQFSEAKLYPGYFFVQRQIRLPSSSI